jgi:hypothetical protein
MTSEVSWYRHLNYVHNWLATIDDADLLLVLLLLVLQPI